MSHKEKVFKLANGARIRVEVDFHFDGFRYKYDKTENTMSWSAVVTYIDKGKSKGRILPPSQHEQFSNYIKETSLELWEEFKPNF